MQLSLTARAIFSGVRGGGRREGSGGRGASCISRELGCNNYYLSHFLAHPPSCAHHYISPHHSTSVGWYATAVVAAAARRASRQIELISGIYRAVDFPFVLSLTRPSSTSDGTSLSARRICPPCYAHTLPLSTASAANKFSTNNKSACGPRWSALHAPKQQREASSRGRIREFFGRFRADRPAGTLTISIKKKRLNVSFRNYVWATDRFLRPLRCNLEVI